MHPSDPQPARSWFARALSWRRAQRFGADELHRCAACRKDFVNPVDWEAVTPEAWWMLLRCGECDVWREVTVTNAVAERFDFELDRRAEILHRALYRLDRQLMTEQVEQLIGALRHDLIDAADFGDFQAAG